MKSMDRREFLKTTATAAAAGGLMASPALDALAKAAEKRKLNVLLIMCDQHNVHATGCYGNDKIKTPGMDRIAKEGVRFENAFTQTGQCCPARYTTWTGRYAHSHGCRWNGNIEPTTETTIGDIFTEAGYETATIGKHHMVNYPTEHGFAHVRDNADYTDFIKATGQKSYTAAAEWMPGLGKKLGGWTRVDNKHNRCGYFADETIDFMRKNKDKPFFAQCSFYGPHTPILPSEPWASMYKPEDIELPPNYYAKSKNIASTVLQKRKQFAKMTEDEHRVALAYYYGFTSQIDANIGRLLDELDTLGLAENTLVIYTADHGEMGAEFGAWTKTVANYDATIRIPMVMRLPGTVPQGIVVDELVGLIDLLPTICNLAGLEFPDNVQGRDMMRVANDNGKRPPWRKVVFSEIGNPGKGMGYSVMARTHEHKYVSLDRGKEFAEQLFDLKKDPWEMVNEIDNPQYATVIGELKQAIVEWNDTTDHAPDYPSKPKTKQKSEAKAKSKKAEKSKAKPAAAESERPARSR